MPEDKGKGKNYSGTFAGGQGPVLGQGISSEKETTSQFGGEGVDKVKAESTGPTVPSSDGREEKGFDLHSKTYAGPENWVPENKGEATPGK